MELIQFLKEKGITYETFALALGVQTSAVGNYVSGLRFPQPEIQGRIYEETKGLVTYSDLYATYSRKKNGQKKSPEPEAIQA